MKNKQPAKSDAIVLSQLCKLIPQHLVAKIARKYGIDKQARTFSPWSHVVALLYAPLTHAIGLNDVCDGLTHHAAQLATIRGATPPAKNTLSHTNKTRDSDMMEELFWEVLKHFQNNTAHFGNRYKGLPKRFKKAVSAIDSSTIALIANCMSWAKHRRRKAAAKLHLRLDLQTFLPACAIVEEASHHDDTRAQQLCANLQEGGTALFDKAYINFLHLFALNRRGVHWVTRAKDNMAYTVKKRLLKKPAGKILHDDLNLLKSPKSRDQYPDTFRRVEMLVELDGKETAMVFITNNTAWAASSVNGVGSRISTNLAISCSISCFSYAVCGERSEMIETLDEVRASAEFEIFREVEKDEEVIGRIVAAQREELEREIAGLNAEAERMAMEMEELAGEVVF